MSSVFVYSAFGLCVSSEFELPELRPGNGEPEVVFRFGAVPVTTRKANDEVHVMNTLAGKFQMNNGREVIVDLLPATDLQLVRVFLLGRAMAGLLRQRGWLPLHASGVEIDGQAVLFIGPSGAGKSTIAAALYARGHPVVTDDVRAVRTMNQQCVVRSGFSRLRLSDSSRQLLGGHHPDSVFQEDKYTVGLKQKDLPVTFPVSRIYILDFGEEARAETISQMQGTASLSIHSLFRRHAFEEDCIRKHVQACALTAAVVPIFQVTRMKSFKRLPDLIKIVEGGAN